MNEYKIGQRWLWSVNDKCTASHCKINTIFEVIENNKMKAIQNMENSKYPSIGNIWDIKYNFDRKNCICISYLKGQDK